MMWNQIIQEDCVSGLAKFAAGSIDLAFADPPFNIGYDYDVYDDRREHAAYLDWSRRWIAAVQRILKPHGTFWLAIGDEYAAELKLASQELGFDCRSWVVWYYTFGVNCVRKFTRSHAHLFHFVKDPENFTFRCDAPENRIPSARQLVYGDARANPRGRLPDDTWILRPQDLAGCFTANEDTWYFPRVAGTFKERSGFHGCQMPEQLLGRIVRACSEEGDVVLDPFSGSATTLAVAKKLGRNYLGFDISPEYVARGRERLARVHSGDPLDGAAEPLVSAPPTPRSGKRGRVADSSPVEASQEMREIARLEQVTRQGLIQAFARVNEGYSLDRVIADPELNRALVEACGELGLVGDARSWNTMLFRLRKAGHLAGIPTQRRTEMSWQECDQFLFASEIALQQVLERDNLSLDNVLCDPHLAGEFDAIAQRFAPGFTSFQYRWGALKLRKEAKLARVRSRLLAPVCFPASVPALDVVWKQVVEQPGIYVLHDAETATPLYVGGTLNLRQRLQFQFGTQHQRNAWRSLSNQLQLQTYPAEAKPSLLIAYQSLLVRKLSSRLNLRDLAER